MTGDQVLPRDCSYTKYLVCSTFDNDSIQSIASLENALTQGNMIASSESHPAFGANVFVMKLFDQFMLYHSRPRIVHQLYGIASLNASWEYISIWYNINDFIYILTKLYDHRMVQRGSVLSYQGNVGLHYAIRHAVDPSENYVMSGGQDGKVRLWSTVKSGELLFEEMFMGSMPLQYCRGQKRRSVTYSYIGTFFTRKKAQTVAHALTCTSSSCDQYNSTLRFCFIKGECEGPWTPDHLSYDKDIATLWPLLRFQLLILIPIPEENNLQHKESISIEEDLSTQ
ncbi:hypothetical protein POM88_034137 [Heracleum sosnowskyi]|uniref:Uncharacterized protein n=1 Tax=Heracleum sosnowskyi TaxID=360622 RepID=A0AAD8HIP3_9APIA|nr:hypothetical protein POM88_034137 [Heracleum sosnowskyi]